MLVLLISIVLSSNLYDEAVVPSIKYGQRSQTMTITQPIGRLSSLDPTTDVMIEFGVVTNPGDFPGKFTINNGASVDCDTMQTFTPPFEEYNSEYYSCNVFLPATNVTSLLFGDIVFDTGIFAKNLWIEVKGKDGNDFEYHPIVSHIADCDIVNGSLAKTYEKSEASIEQSNGTISYDSLAETVALTCGNTTQQDSGCPISQTIATHDIHIRNILDEARTLLLQVNISGSSQQISNVEIDAELWTQVANLVKGLSNLNTSIPDLTYLQGIMDETTSLVNEINANLTKMDIISPVHLDSYTLPNTNIDVAPAPIEELDPLDIEKINEVNSNIQQLTTNLNELLGYTTKTEETLTNVSDLFVDGWRLPNMAAASSYSSDCRSGIAENVPGDCAKVLIKDGPSCEVYGFLTYGLPQEWAASIMKLQRPGHAGRCMFAPLTSIPTGEGPTLEYPQNSFYTTHGSAPPTAFGGSLTGVPQWTYDATQWDPMTYNDGTLTNNGVATSNLGFRPKNTGAAHEFPKSMPTLTVAGVIVVAPTDLQPDDEFIVYMYSEFHSEGNFWIKHDAHYSDPSYPLFVFIPVEWFCPFFACYMVVVRQQKTQLNYYIDEGIGSMKPIFNSTAGTQDKSCGVCFEQFAPYILPNVDPYIS